MRGWLPQTANLTITSSTSLLALLVHSTWQQRSRKRPEQQVSRLVTWITVKCWIVLKCRRTEMFVSHVGPWFLKTHRQHSCKTVSGEFHYISNRKLRLIWCDYSFMHLLAAGLPILASVAGVICYCCCGVFRCSLGRLTCCQQKHEACLEVFILDYYMRLIVCCSYFLVGLKAVSVMCPCTSSTCRLIWEKASPFC